MINTGLNIKVQPNLEITYSDDTYGPENEQRHLDDIRQSLLDPSASGPSLVYAIAMDVGRRKDFEDLKKRMLLYGVCAYSKGKIGREPVRSQGHIHAISASCQSSTPEVYEVWSGEAIIMMQPNATDTPERCYAVHVKPGEVVVVPPKWAHCTINGDPKNDMIFGAWCIRDFGFEYDAVRAHHGLAFYPIANEDDTIGWLPNQQYRNVELIDKNVRSYQQDLKITPQIPIYQQYIDQNDKFDFVTNPSDYQQIWDNYQP